MKETEKWLKQLDECWKREPAQKHPWWLFWLTPAQRIEILREVMLPQTPRR